MKHTKIGLGFAILIAALILAAPGLAQVKNHNDIKYPKLPDFEIPQPLTFTLDNGMQVFLMEDRELPLISVTARIRTGSNYMPAEKEGMGSVFGQVQREGGTASMTGDEMDDFLEARAAFVETGMSGDSASASMNCLKEDFDEVFDVFLDVLREPAFAEDKIELAKVQLNTSIARRNDNVGGIVGREFRRLVYGTDSPLARLTEYATVSEVTRDDLVAWHGKYYHPNNILLGVSGDFNPAEIKSTIESALASWSKGTAFNEAEVSYQKEAKPGVYFIEKEDVTQANIRMGHLGIKRDNPDYYAVVVMNEILGGGFSGRLMQNIRSEKGLAYSVFGGIGASFLRPGIFQAGMSTKSETMAESVAALKEEVAGMIVNPPTEAEMQHAKESILNSFVFNYTSRGQILGQQMTFAYFGLPSDYLEQYRSNIEKVKAEQVGAVAKKYLHPDKMALLVVGKSAEFDEPVASLGDVTEIDIAIPPPADKRPEVVKTASSIEAGAEILERMATKVLNGVEATVESGTAKFTIVMDMGGQKMSLGQEVSYVLPDKVRQMVRTPMGEIVTVINGDQGVMMRGGAANPLPGEMAEKGVKQLGRDLLILASNVGHPELEAVAGGTDEVDGTSCDVVAVTFKGTESRLCVNGEGAVLKQSYQGNHPLQGTPGTVTLLFSDYAELGGRMLPRMSALNFEGQEVARVMVDSMEVNPQIDPSLFELPAGE